MCIEEMLGKKCTLMQTEVAFLAHIVGRTGLACDPVKMSVVRAWHVPSSVKQVRQFVGFLGYYHRFIQNFAELSEPLVALTQKGAIFAWTPERQEAFVKLKSSLLQARYWVSSPQTTGLYFVLDTVARREVVIAYASHSLQLSQRHYCTTHYVYTFSLVLTGCAVHSAHRSPSLRWLQKFRNIDGMLARWYMLLCQFSVTFEYLPGAQHANADGLSCQRGQCLRPDCPVSSPDVSACETRSTSEIVDQPFAASTMGGSMYSDLLPELLGETWVSATYLDKVTVICHHLVWNRI